MRRGVSACRSSRGTRRLSRLERAPAIRANAGNAPHIPYYRPVGRIASLIEEIAVPIDVRRQVQRMLARQAFRKLRVTALQRLDDLQMVNDGTRCAIALRDGRAPDRADVQ